MDFLLEEEMIDILTFCLQSPDSDETESKKQRLKEIGQELFNDGGVDAMENFFFVVENRIIGEIEKDPKPYRNLWNNITNEWNY
jgi:hypothetical protein|tara:strand:- start:5871 stop:6122 length:252 start_codon:yes stop_codon:yes gene_type:complete